MNELKQRTYIKLVEIGNRENDVLAVLSRIRGLKRTPEQLIASVPCYISDDTSRALAEQVKMHLEKAGAVVEIEDDLSEEVQGADILATEFEQEESDLPLFERSGYETSGVENDNESSETDPIEMAFTTSFQPPMPGQNTIPDVDEGFIEVPDPAEEFDSRDQVQQRVPKQSRTKLPQLPILGMALLVVVLLAYWTMDVLFREFSKFITTSMNKIRWRGRSEL